MGLLGEDCIKKYHQNGFRYDFCFSSSRVGDVEKQASVQREHIARSPQVVMVKELKLEDSRERRRRRGLVKGVQNQIKEERRHEVLLKV